MIRIQKNLLGRLTVGQTWKAISMSPEQTSSTAEVFHNDRNSMFYLPRLENAVLQYKISGNNIEFYHTEVPEVHRGKGYAKLLVKAGLDFAQSKHYNVVATCSYVEKYMRENNLK